MPEPCRTGRLVSVRAWPCLCLLEFSRCAPGMPRRVTATASVTNARWAKRAPRAALGMRYLYRLQLRNHLARASTRTCRRYVPYKTVTDKSSLVRADLTKATRRMPPKAFAKQNFLRVPGQFQQTGFANWFPLKPRYKLFLAACLCPAYHTS